MDFYRSGQRAAAESFFKEADYADSLAQLWERAAPTKTPLAAKVVGGLAGAVPGAALGSAGGAALGWHASPTLKFIPDSLVDWVRSRGSELPDHPAGRGPTDWGNPQLGKKIDQIIGRTAGGGALGGVLGGAGGAFAGVKGVGAAHRALLANRRAAAIRGLAPKAGLALGATATAAALAKHFLSKGSDERRPKHAAIFGASEPYDVDTASIPYSMRRKELHGYLKEKSKEEPTSWLKSIGGGAVGGGLLGAILGAVTGHPGAAGVGALVGGGVGAGVGGLTGGVAGLADRANISSAQKTLKSGPSAIDQRLHKNVRYQRAMDSLNDFMIEQNRHDEMMRELRRRNREGSEY